MSREEELDAELKSFEAALALLTPRTDRLGRDRLIFLAGQASVVSGSDRLPIRQMRWAWPAVCAVMTTAAAAMLVMLLMRPGPQVLVKYVEVPAEAAAEANEPEPSPEDTPPAWPEHERPEPTTQPVSGPSLLAAFGLGFGENRWRGKSLYWQRVERALNREPDWQTSASGTWTPAAPVPYRQLRDRLLQEALLQEALPGGSTSDPPFNDHSLLLNPGVNS